MLYAIIIPILLAIVSAIGTFIAYFLYPVYFDYLALATAGLVLFEVVFVVVTYLSILFSVAYKK